MKKFGTQYWMAAFFFTILFQLLIFGLNPIDYKNQSYTNSGDQRLNMLIHQWNIDWVFGDVPPDTLNYWDYVILHPYKQSLALSVNHLGSLPINLLLNIFEKDWMARGNIWIFLCFVLNALSCYLCLWLLFRSLKGPAKIRLLDQILIASAISLSFAYSLNRINYIDHAQTLPNFALPFFIYFGYRAITEFKSKYCILSALFLVWQFYLDIHLALMGILLVTLSTPLILYTLKNNKLPAKVFGRQIFIFIGLSVVFLLPLALPYLETAAIFGDRGFFPGPSMRHYFKPTYYSQILYDLLPGRSSNEMSVLPHYLFIPGLILLAIGLIGSAIRAMRGRDKKVFVFLFLLFLIGSYIDFIVHRSGLAELLTNVIPGLTSVRTPGRFSILLGPLFWGIVIYLAYQTPHKKLALKRWVLTLILVTFTIEASTLRLVTWERPNHKVLESVFQKLEGPAIFLPYSLDPYVNLDFMMYAQEYQVKIANGYSGFLPQGHYDLWLNRKHFTSDWLKRISHSYYQETVIDLRVFDKKIAGTMNGTKVGHYLILRNTTPISQPKNWQNHETYFSWISEKKEAQGKEAQKP